MCCLVTTKGIVFHTGGSSYCVVTQLRGHQWQRAKVWAARDPALTWTMPPLGCKGVRSGRKLNPSSQIWHEVPSFLQGNIKNSSVPQMATLSTSRGVRCVFWRGSFQVPTQIVSRPHLRTGRLLYPLAIRALTPELLWSEANKRLWQMRQIHRNSDFSPLPSINELFFQNSKTLKCRNTLVVPPPSQGMCK